MAQKIDLSNTSRVTKSYLLDHLVTEKGFTRSDAVEAVEGVVDAIVAALRSGVAVNLSNVGTFRPVVSPAAVRRNPATGGKVAVPASGRVRWTASPTLLDVINGRTERKSLSRKAPKGSL